MRPARDDAGFTLVELLVATVIVAAVMPAIASVMIVYFRTADVASVRTDRGHDANLFSSYFQPDVASATTATVSGTCDNELAFGWTETRPLPNGTSDAPVVYEASYAVEASSASNGPFVVRRTLTKDGASAGSNVVMHNLETGCAVTFAKSGTPTKVVVTATPGDSSGRAEAAPLSLSGYVGGRR